MAIITPVSLFGNQFGRSVPVFIESEGSSTRLTDILNFSDYSQIVVGDFDSVNNSFKENIVSLDKYGGVENSLSVPTFGTNVFDGVESVLEFKKFQNNNIIIGGAFETVNGIGTKYICRLDRNFNRHSKQFPQTLNAPVVSMDTFPSIFENYVCVCGNFTAPRSKVALYLIDGTNDITLASMSISPTGTVYQVKFTYASDGIFIIGNCSLLSRHGIIPVTTLGNLGGTFNANISSLNKDVRVMTYVDRNTLNADVLIGGNFTIGSTQYCIARLEYLTGNVVGSWATDLNPSFTIESIYYENNPDSPNYNKILCATNSALYLIDGTTGLMDTTFNNNTGFVAATNIKKITSVENGNIVLIGSFLSVNGDTTRKRYTVLTPDGSQFI